MLQNKETSIFINSEEVYLKARRVVLLYKQYKKIIQMQRQIIVEHPLRDDQRQNDELGDMVQTRDRSYSFVEEEIGEEYGLEQGNYRREGSNGAQGGNYSQIYAVNGRYQNLKPQQSQQHQQYNTDPNESNQNRNPNNNSMTMYMQDINGYLENANQSMQLQHQAHQQASSNALQQQYWSKYFKNDSDSDDSISDEEDNKQSSQKMKQIFDNQEENMAENIVTFKKILKQHQFDDNIADSKLRRLIQLILPNPYQNGPKNIMQFGHILRKQSFQKLNRNYKTIIKKPIQDISKQNNPRQIRVSFNSEVSLKLFRRQQQVSNLYFSSQIVEQINQMQKRGRITHAMLMKQWQHYQRQPLYSKFTIGSYFQQWILPTQIQLAIDGTQSQNNDQCIEQVRFYGRDLNYSRREYANIYRTVDLKVISIRDRANFYDEIND